MTRILPLFLLLSACSSMVHVEVQPVSDRVFDFRAYDNELRAAPNVLDVMMSFRAAIASRAEQLCGGNYTVLADEREPGYFILNQRVQCN